MSNKENKVLTIPNALSVVRILLIPLFAYLYFKGHYALAAIVLTISGLTDVVDGFIARTFNMISTLGKILDPFADKLTQLVVVLCLAIRHKILIPLLIVFYAKELLMLSGSAKLLKSGTRPSEAKWWGKLSTVVIYVLLMLVLISDIWPTLLPVWVLPVFIVITAISILFSLYSYYLIFKDIQSGKYDMSKESHNKE
ncbi:MAG: CDP-alcohol phosphatidyltransferase family protein [Clostridia bacterium]|nr:CDP-alcohol phosphatidyltransferase family protein [Clostridia bacterium]